MSLNNADEPDIIAQARHGAKTCDETYGEGLPAGGYPDTVAGAEEILGSEQGSDGNGAWFRTLAPPSFPLPVLLYTRRRGDSTLPSTAFARVSRMGS